MITFAVMFAGLWLGFEAQGRVDRALGHPWQRPAFADYGSGIAIGSMIFGIIILIDLWIMARAQATRLETEAAQAWLSAIRAQLNPHFLFNALNTIASTVATDPRAAEETTLRLAELYRGILGSSQGMTHPLERELEICQAYLEVESARFTDRLRWRVDADPDAGRIEIPSLLIQPLIENALKHGIAPRASGGRIDVRVSRTDGFVEIAVEDDGIGFGSAPSRRGTGTGLSSCRSRLELTYGSRASFEVGPRDTGGTRARLRIPVQEEARA